MSRRLADKVLWTIFSQRYRLRSKEGVIYTYNFTVFKRKCFIMTSDIKWRKGEQFQKTPIWTNRIGDKLPTLFIGKIAIGYEPKKKEGNEWQNR